MTEIRAVVGSSEAQAKGTVVKSAGWRAVRGEKEEDDGGGMALPNLEQDETLPVKALEAVERQTKPKPLHTESSLLSAMEHCGREIDDEQLRASIRETGIGTPATRAAVIETLFARGYIQREKKSLVPTDKGMAVYETVKDKKIANVEMTAAWEDTLARIESGERIPVSQMLEQPGAVLPQGRQMRRCGLWLYPLPQQGRQGTVGQTACRTPDQRQNRCHQRLQKQGGKGFRRFIGIASRLLRGLRVC